MASERQIQANRANSLKSTGPRTLHGKKISSRNALTHGLARGDVEITQLGSSSNSVAARLAQIRHARSEAWRKWEQGGQTSVELIDRLVKLDRYDQRVMAIVRRERNAFKLADLQQNDSEEE